MTTICFLPITSGTFPYYDFFYFVFLWRHQRLRQGTSVLLLVGQLVTLINVQLIDINVLNLDDKDEENWIGEVRGLVLPNLSCKDPEEVHSPLRTIASWWWFINLLVVEATIQTKKPQSIVLGGEQDGESYRYLAQDRRASILWKFQGLNWFKTHGSCCVCLESATEDGFLIIQLTQT